MHILISLTPHAYVLEKTSQWLIRDVTPRPSHSSNNLHSALARNDNLHTKQTTFGRHQRISLAPLVLNGTQGMFELVLPHATQRVLEQGGDVAYKRVALA